MVFDPSTLAGKVLWLRAKDNTGANGSSITTWADQSGAGCDAYPLTASAPTVATASTPLSGKSVRFVSGTPLVLGASGLTLNKVRFSSQTAGHEAVLVFTPGNIVAWHMGGVVGFIDFEVVTAQASTQYSLTSHGDSAVLYPRDWTFQGSNNRVVWTTLDTRTGVTTAASTTNTYTFTNAVTYKFFRLNITANSYGAGPTIFDRMAVSDGTTAVVPITGVKPGELWAVLKSDGGQQGPWNFGNDIAGDSVSLYPNGATTSDNFGRLNRKDWTTGTPTTWHIFRAATDGATWTAWIDGTQVAADTGAPVDWTANNWRLGRGYYGGGGNFVDFNGNFAEVLVRSQISTSGEATDITAYLTAEHFTAPPAPAPTGSAPVSVASSSAASVVVTATGSAPVAVGSSSEASTVDTVATATGSAPVAAGSSSAALSIATVTGSAAVGAGSSSESSIVGAVVSATGSAPVSVGSSSSASIAGILALVGWSADESRKTYLDLGSETGELDYTPPIVAGVGTWYLPPVGTLVLPPAGLTERVIYRHSVSVPAMTPGTDHTVRVSDYDTYPTVDAVLGVVHVLIGGQDWTYLRGTPVGIGADRAEQPFGDVTLTIDLPQVTPQDTPGTGDLAVLKPGARVELVLLNGTAMTRLWCGHLVSDDGGNDERAPRTAWTASGTLWQASTFGHRVPVLMPPADIGTIIPRSLNRVLGRVYPVLPNVATGIMTTQRGSSADSELAYVQTLLATAWTPSTQWTVAKVAGTSRTYTLRGKDLVTVHQTVTTGARGVDVNLSRDMTSTANCLFGRGISVTGHGWAGWCWPNFLADAAPAYPYASGSTTIDIGDTDAGTLTGTGVSDWQRRANDLDFSRNVAVDGVYNAADAAACLAIQKAGGLTEDGIVGPQTWASTFSVGSAGGDLNGAYRRPLAIDPATEPYTYSASGAVTGANPLYTGAMRYERDTDYGPGVSKAEATQSAIRELARDKNPGLSGTIVLTEDPREGSRFLITPGQNIRLLGYGGGNPLLHIADVTRDWNALTVTLTVDEHARDSITLAAIRNRIKSAQADPARRPGRTDRRSRQVSDTVIPFDSESSAGIIPRHALYGGLWTVIKIPLSEVGDAAKIEVRTTGPAAKFSLWLFAGPVTPAHMVSLVGDPLTGTNPTARTEAKGDALDDLGLIEAFGGPGNACGYGYGEEGTDPITGWLKDNKGFHYTSTEGGWIWVAEWSPVSTFISGRIYPAPIQ